MSFFFVFIFISFPVIAAAPSDADSLAEGLGTGWSDSNYGYPSGWQNSWFWRVYDSLRSFSGFSDGLKSGWTDSASGYPSGWNNSWFWRVYDKLRTLSTISSSVTSIDSSVSSISTSSSSISSYLSDLKSGWSSTNTGGINSPSGYASSWFSQVFYELRQLELLSTGLSYGWGYTSTSTNAPTGFTSSWFYSLLNLSRLQYLDLESISSDTSSIKSSASDSRSFLADIKGYLLSLQEFFANPVDRVLKERSESTVSAVSQEYFSGDGGSEQSIKASNTELGDFKGIGKFFRRFDSGVSISSLVELFDPDNDQYGLFTWLSQQNAESLNPLYSSRRSMTKSSSFEPIVTDYYHENLDLITTWERDHS